MLRNYSMLFTLLHTMHFFAQASQVDVCFVDAAATESCGENCGPECEYCGQKDNDGFHLKDAYGCSENDPNGPVLDPVHGVIHHFYQAHIARPGGSGPVYGHFVSKDFVHWAAMPHAIWNGLDLSTNESTLYDEIAIYTGSAAVVAGAGPDGIQSGVVQIYPGLCEINTWPNCSTGTLLVQAVPFDYAEDQLLTRWTKTGIILNNTERDPTTPWKTQYGEWRLRTFDAQIYAAANDTALLSGDWYHVGTSSSLQQAECPSLYVLPRLTPGFTLPSNKTISHQLPTHVHKISTNNKDYWQLGNYVDGPPGEIGNFSAAIGWEDLFGLSLIDAGNYYASKDSLYPTRSNSSDSPKIQRRINWGWAQISPQSAQSLPREITFNPRTRRLEQAPIEELIELRQKKDSIFLNDIPQELPIPSNRTEFILSLPSSFSLNTTVTIGSCATCSLVLYNYSVSLSCGNFQDQAPFLDTEKALELRIFADSTFLELYVQSGRIAMTYNCIKPLSEEQLSTLKISGSTENATLHLYALDSIWVDSETIRAAPRLYFS